MVWGADLTTTRGAALERIALKPARWQTAGAAWSDSAGDHGSPGATAGPAASPAPEPTRPPSNPGPAPAPTDGPPDWQGPAPAVYISEVLANPDAVNDSVGEWIELFNSTAKPVDLRGWVLADLGSDRHTIRESLVVPANGYVVLGRSTDRRENGGVRVDYVFSSLSLANVEDEVLLLAPDGTEVDRVVWGADLTTTRGAALERIALKPARWQTAGAAWSGSAGDHGSPGATAGPAANPSAPDQPGLAPTPAQTPVPPSADWVGPAPALYLNEVMVNPAAVGDSEGEWIEFFNPGDVPVNLRGWLLADLGSDRHVIGADFVVPAGGYAVAARLADPSLNGGVAADYVYTGISLANGDDELLLTAPDGTEVDRLLWGGATGVTVPDGASLQRMDYDVSIGLTPSGAPWPGSAGDAGTPGQANVAAPLLAPTPTATGRCDT